MLDIHPDITLASTPSAEFYRSDEMFERSKREVFGKSWQLVGRADEVDNVAPFTILDGFLDEPVVFTRQDGNITCFSNVCTHRGKILCEEPCRASGLRCDYHGRRFDLGGRFLSMPEFEQTKDFPTEKDDLARVPSEVFGGLLFASPAPAASFAETFAPVVERLGWLDWASYKFAPDRSRDYFVNAHWALYCENYLEGFHVPYVHPALSKTYDYASYTTETFGRTILQTAFTDDRATAFAWGDGNVAALYFFVFPNLMLNFYPWGLSVNIVKPLRKDLTKVVYMTFVGDESRLGTGAGGDLARVELEDQSVVESVQRGIQSSFYDRGRYSPTREQGTHRFHRLLAESMS